LQKLLVWENKLRDKNIRVTSQRIAIIEVLLKEAIPLAAGDIFAKIKNRPELKLSTVYRNLNLLVDERLVRKLNFKGKGTVFELLEDHHQHLICLECGDVKSIQCPLQNYEEELHNDTGYELYDHNIEFYGVCPACKNS